MVRQTANSVKGPVFQFVKNLYIQLKTKLRRWADDPSIFKTRRYPIGL